ncbi:MAG: sugar phosphate nucleotidyltransferase [Cytophagales bacterium]
MIKNNYLVIMAGGVGSRFWPFSRNAYPKQFHDLFNTGKTLLQQTIDRYNGLIPNENIFIVTNKSYVDLVKRDLPFLNQDQILLEPEGRNTAPCIAYSCYKIYKNNPISKIIVAPSDHIITNEIGYQAHVKAVLDEIDSNVNELYLLGIKPNRPDTGYGYIQYDKTSQGNIKKLIAFKEKPNIQTAKKFLSEGGYLWNSGIFLFSAKAIVDAFEKYSHNLHDIFFKGNEFYWTDKEQAFIDEIYPTCDNISIDYAIFEKATNVHVLPSDFGWSDLGTWKSLYELSDKNKNENVLDGNIVTYDTSKCIIKTPSDKLVVVQGLENYIVAESNGILMICNKDEEQRVKEFVTDLKEKHGKKYI